MRPLWVHRSGTLVHEGMQAPDFRVLLDYQSLQLGILLVGPCEIGTPAWTVLDAGRVSVRDGTTMLNPHHRQHLIGGDRQILSGHRAGLGLRSLRIPERRASLSKTPGGS
jgi:hypothetical protein